jgi:deoxynucleotide monophosphate kinase-like protein
MRCPIIGIHGPAGAGKDTLAEFMLAADPTLYRYALASPIKRMLAAGLNIDMSDPYWVAHKENIIPLLGKSPRQLMQTLGTEWGREMVNPDLWVIIAQAIFVERGRGMVVTDVRFEDEAKWIRENGGRIVRIQRAGALSVNPHASEVGIPQDMNDVFVVNNGTLEDLQIRAHEIVHGV